MIKNHFLKRFDSLLNQCFKHQYSKDALESFGQLDNSRKVIIIDDFDQSGLNLTFKHALVKRLNAAYPRIIITGNNFFQLEEMLSDENPEENGAFENYKQFSILEFGYRLRSQLINIWNTLGQEESVEKWDLIRRNDFVERIVNTIIGNNLVPSYPLFLLTILQSVEAGTVHDLKESVYSHYYEYLITHALIKTNIGPDELDAYHNYITELSYHFFAKEIKEISQNDLCRFHQWFCDEYSLTLGFDMVITRLLNALILKDNRGVYRFRYRYVFYFFVAKYFSDNFSENAIKEKISEMCKALYREEFANIILFLTHHSKEPFILEEILQNAKSHFAEFEIARFDKDVSNINTLLDEIPQLVLSHIDVKENRERHHKMQDALEISNGEKRKEEIEEISEEDVHEMDLVTKLNSAFKTIEILGQVLKNYYGSLKGKRKLALGEELYFIGLRALNACFSLLEENKDVIGAKITSAIEERSVVDKDKIERLSQRFLFTLFVMFSLGFTKKISGAIGSERLSETFKEILDKHADITSIQMIDISIKLDFFKAFPYEDIKKLKRDISGNYLPYDLLRRLVIDYLYMFPTDYKERQRICHTLGISMKAQRAIDRVSSQKKKK